MKITIIGASAGVGLEVTRLALQKGHDVTTLSRRIVPIPDHAKLTRVQGSVTPVVNSGRHELQLHAAGC
jgi:uncharacterized protein YbjT (DUF2867 family)